MDQKTGPQESLEQRIDKIPGTGGRVFLANSCKGLSSSTGVFYTRDGDLLLFFIYSRGHAWLQAINGTYLPGIPLFDQ